ncbi:MAG TPA: hypothetical protein DCP31_31610 [Cyanobacteria bacterium UBA8543]|nr:hypothetical protein [Cyanobacteria bacterium UBA8543]
MKKITALELYPDNFAFRIYDASLSSRDTFHTVTQHTLAQGFSRRPGSYNFSTLGDCMNLRIEVWLADQQEEVDLRNDTVRAIMVPFSVSEAGIMIADFMGLVEQLIRLTQGEYALVFEINVRNDAEYLNSPQYQENVEIGFTQEWCYLTFYSRVEPVQPEILRVDAWSSPPYPFQSYCPLNPNYPLLMETSLA